MPGLLGKNKQADYTEGGQIVNTKTDFLEHVQKTNVESQLKPCPFCGYNTPKFTEKRSGNYRRTGDIIQVLCGRCKARRPIVVGKYDKNGGRFVRNSYNNGQTYNDILQTAADKWNGRAGVKNE